MECPFCTGEPACDYAVACEVLGAALDEAEELRTALNAELDTLKFRIQQLEKYIADAALTYPSELF